MQQQQPNQTLPEVIRVKAQKGFRGIFDGQFAVANPGDVVDVPRLLALELRAAGKAYMVSEERRRQANYLPARKKTAPKDTPSQLQALTDTVQALVVAVTAMTKRKGE